MTSPEAMPETFVAKAVLDSFTEALWMLTQVNGLIDEFKVRFADTAGVWRCLHRIGYPHHRPGRRATRRNEQAIRAWIVFENESGTMLAPPVCPVGRSQAQ